MPTNKVKRTKSGDADTVNPRLPNSVMFPKAKAKATSAKRKKR